jgi:hypothetical protein
MQHVGYCSHPFSIASSTSVFLVAKITKECQQIHSSLKEIQDRAKLEGLRRKSEEMTGSQSEGSPMKIEVNLEIDVADIRQEFQALSNDVKQERLKS